VFISYSRGDGDYVADLAARLQAEGLTVWTDKGVRVGTQWVREIERQIIDCAAFVPVMSERSKDANWVDREIDLAEERRKPIAPLLLSGRPFFRLRHLQYEDVRDGNMPGEEFVAGLRAMIDQGRQIPLYRGTAQLSSPAQKRAAAGSADIRSAPRAEQPRTRRPSGLPRWMAPALGVAAFLLFFVGTFLIMRAFDGDGEESDLGVKVGSCVVEDANGTLGAGSCTRPGAQVITQIVAAGRLCDDPRDVQHLFRAPDRPSVCVRPEE